MVAITLTEEVKVSRKKFGVKIRNFLSVPSLDFCTLQKFEKMLLNNFFGLDDTLFAFALTANFGLEQI